MQVKMNEILNFATFYGVVRNQKLGIRTAYKLNQLARAIDVEVKFYQEKFQEILNEYGEKDENGQLIYINNGEQIKLREGMAQTCYAAINDLQQLDVELPDTKFSIDEFANIELTADNIGYAIPFIAD